MLSLNYFDSEEKDKLFTSINSFISEESSILNFPVITDRNSMERPEGLDTGSIILTGLIKQTVLDAINIVLFEKESKINRELADEYKVANTSMRALKLIIGTVNLSNEWYGINK